jgi:hypothetical protein
MGQGGRPDVDRISAGRPGSSKLGLEGGYFWPSAARAVTTRPFALIRSISAAA